MLLFEPSFVTATILQSQKKDKTIAYSYQGCFCIMSHVRRTIALVCGIWQCITVIEALLQNEVPENELIFIIDVNHSDLPMTKYIEKMIRVFFIEAPIQQIEDARPTGLLEWISGLIKIRAMCGIHVRQVYTAYSTYVSNLVLGAYRNVENLVLVDDGIAHYQYLKIMQDHSSFSVTKNLLDSCGLSYSACRIHGQLNKRYVNRMKYLHIYPDKEVDSRLARCAQPANHELLRSVISRVSPVFDEHLGSLNFDAASYIVLGSVSTDELWRKWEESVSNVLQQRCDHCLYKPHPRSDLVTYAGGLSVVRTLFKYVPVEVVTSRHENVTLVGGESSSIRNCQILYGTRHETYSDFVASNTVFGIMN
jgi:hypothetical protein